MAYRYRAQVEELYAALQEDSEARRMGAAELSPPLVKEIVLMPNSESGELQIEVHGGLAGTLTIAQEC